MLKIILFLFLFLGKYFVCLGQISFSGNLVLDEYQRMNSLHSDSSSVFLRSSSVKPFLSNSSFDSTLNSKKIYFRLLPFFSTFKVDLLRPSINNDYGLIPTRGFQNSLSPGIFLRYGKISFQIQPEFIFSQNLKFRGFSNDFPLDVLESRFLYWNYSDYPQRFGKSSYNRFYFGQSSLNLALGAFEFGIGTKNYWWGPGQWNSLIFSYNSPGFPNISFNTTKPAKTLVGSFEGQLFMGRLESSGFSPTQDDFLDSTFFRPLNSDWRYINGIMISYSPKFLRILSLGFGRTFQFYNSDRIKGLKGLFPVFEPLAKNKLFTNGNSVFYDNLKQSQQIAIFGRVKLIKASTEFYFQYGRRDHALNWREFFLNPEHARAYQLGFVSVKNLWNNEKKLQIRGEITHQQESVNRILRYGLVGGISWHTHSQVRGFTNYGQPMGVSFGTGSNMQILEISVIEGLSKFGFSIERLENNQDFYYKSLVYSTHTKPWIDWTSSLLINYSIGNILLSSRLQSTYAKNYQWRLDKNSTIDFPSNKNLFSFHSQANLIYFFNRSKNK